MPRQIIALEDYLARKATRRVEPKEGGPAETVEAVQIRAPEEFARLLKMAAGGKRKAEAEVFNELLKRHPKVMDDLRQMVQGLI